LRKEFFHLPPLASSNPFQGALHLFIQARDFHFGASILRGIREGADGGSLSKTGFRVTPIVCKAGNKPWGDWYHFQHRGHFM
jgi:hypothetical protein